jgi:hypothetical protein
MPVRRRSKTLCSSAAPAALTRYALLRIPVRAGYTEREASAMPRPRRRFRRLALITRNVPGMGVPGLISNIAIAAIVPNGLTEAKSTGVMPQGIGS